MKSILKHPSGQSTHVIVDDFTDPWLPQETILIQHGFGRHSAFWYHWVPVLASRYRVIRRDARGHGLSSHPDDRDYNYSVETICDEIIDTLDQLGIEKVHFLGESTSGMVGHILAVRAPERLQSLITCSSPTHLPPAALSLFAFGEPDWPSALRILGSKGWAERLSQIPGTLATSDPSYRQWWIEQVSVSCSEGLAGYAGFLSTLDSRKYLSEITVPTLILAPSNSAATSLEQQRSIHDSIKGSVLEVVQSEGHEIYTEAPKVCQQAVLAFLDDLPYKRACCRASAGGDHVTWN